MPLTRVLRVKEVGARRVIEESSEALLSGKLVVLPTETVYGLASKATFVKSVERIFIVKNRPLEPLTIHFSRIEDVEDLVDEEHLYVVERAWNKLWPGPLTLIVRASSYVPKIVTAGLPCVGLRAPIHPITSRVLDRVGPVVMPSANVSGRPSPFTGFEALLEMFGRADLVVDAGPCIEGLESTIVNLCSSPPTILRLGPIPPEEVSAIVGKPVEISRRALGLEGRARYRISKPLVLVEGDSSSPSYVSKVLEVARELASKGDRVAILCKKSREGVYRVEGFEVVSLSDDPFEAARQLFTALRTLESLSIDVVVAENWGYRGVGLAITSRLRSASISAK